MSKLKNLTDPLVYHETPVTTWRLNNWADSVWESAVAAASAVLGVSSENATQACLNEFPLQFCSSQATTNPAPTPPPTSFTREQLVSQAAQLEDRAVAPLVSSMSNASLYSSINILPNQRKAWLNLQFSGSDVIQFGEPVSDFSLLVQAQTIRNTMLLRACKIALDVDPALQTGRINAHFANSRVLILMGALRLQADLFIPSDVSLDRVAVANAEAQLLMNSLANISHPDEHMDGAMFSTWWVDKWTTLAWNATVDVISNVVGVNRDNVTESCRNYFPSLTDINDCTFVEPPQPTPAPTPSPTPSPTPTSCSNQVCICVPAQYAANVSTCLETLH